MRQLSRSLLAYAAWNVLRWNALSPLFCVADVLLEG